MKKLISILVAFAMMATLAVCMAFAADTVPTADVDDKASATDGKIVKYLVVPDGVKDFPTVKSTFGFEAVDGTGTTAAEADVIKPDAVDITIEKESTETNPSQASATQQDGLSRVANVAIPALKLTDDTHAGVYTYTVEETACAIQNPTAATGTLTPDGAKYTIRYTVAINSEGKPYTKYVTVTKYDKETKQTTTVTDPTTGWDTTEDTSDDNDGGFSFKNTYKLTEGDNTFENAPLKISKTVDGTPEDLATKTFPIKVTLTKAVGADDTVLKAGIYENGTLVADSEKDVPYGTETTFNIKHGQTVAFLKMPVGTKYVTNEALANAAEYSAYGPSVAVNTDEYTGSANLGQTLQGQAADTQLLLQEDDKDLVAYTNKYNPEIDTPTGILISNLPYIALALVAIGGLVAYVVVRRRQDDEA